MTLTNQQIQNELLFQKSQEITKELLEKGLITSEIAQRIEQENRKLSRHYWVHYCLNSLMCLKLRANMHD